MIPNRIYDEKNRSLLIRLESGDSDALGAEGDQAVEEEGVDLCVVYAKDPSGYKFAVRSCTNEVRADEAARYFSESVGAGGGQRYKAGGFISGCLIPQELSEHDRYFQEKLQQYFAKYQIIRAQNYIPDLTQMNRYQKKKTKIGVVCTRDFLKAGIPVLIRTMEGDMECVSAPDLYIMIGIDGEVYPIRKEKFELSYEFTDGKPEYACEYEPSVYNTITGETYGLNSFTRTCQARGISCIYAKKLEKAVKIFTQWDEDKYLKGEKDDYIAVREDDLSDVYVIEKSVFLRTYERCE